MFSFRDMQAADLAMVRAWRNAPEIGQYLFSQDEISVAEHKAWFQAKKNNPQHHLKIFIQENKAYGFLQLVAQHKELKNYEWGFYITPAYLKQGFGKKLVHHALHYAFIDLDADKLIGKVVLGNSVSKRLHEASGFTCEGRLRNECIANKCVQDILYFGLLKQEWLRQNEK